MNPTKLLWVDVETTGLSADIDAAIAEAGYYSRYIQVPR